MIDLTQLQKTPTAQEQAEASDRLYSIAYLESTDWYVTRFAETGKPVPEAILEERAKARIAAKEKPLN